MNTQWIQDIERVLESFRKQVFPLIDARGYMLFFKQDEVFECFDFFLPEDLSPVVDRHMIKISFKKNPHHLLFPLSVLSVPFIEARQSHLKDKMLFFQKNVQSLFALPLIHENRCMGLFVCLDVQEPAPSRKAPDLARMIAPLVPPALHALEWMDYQALKKQVDFFKKKFSQYNQAIRILNQLSVHPYQDLLKQVLDLFPFDMAYLMFEKKGKMVISEGSSSRPEYEEIYQRLYAFFSQEENMPLADKPEMALCLAYQSKKHYYFKDMQEFLPLEKWVHRMDEYPAAAKDKKAIQMVGRKIRSILHMPVIEQETCLGVLELFSFDENVVDLQSEDIQMIENLAGFIPSILKNKTLYKKLDEKNRIIESKNRQLIEELKLAKSIQQGLIPSSTPNLTGIALAALYKPMEEVGGDFYDFIRIREPDHLGIFISDVSGHGVPAALITSMVKTLVETAGENRVKPSGLLRYINEKISGQTGGNFLTAFYGVYDRETRVLSYARGAHNPPYLIRNREVILLESRGKVLGLLEGLDFEEKQVHLNPGDRIIFYTDGLTEAENEQGEEFEEPLLKILKSNFKGNANEFLDHVYHRLLEHRGGYHFDDDVCVVVMEVE